MAVCPFAVAKLIPAGSNDPRITPRAFILHVAVMLGDSLYDYFAHRSGGIESHFYIRKSGVIEQYRDTNYQADANLDANDFALSVETEGMGEGEWTPEQIASIQRLFLWARTVHPQIAARKIQTWDGSGLGYHTLFGAPSHWTPVVKTCPGPQRVKQFEAVLVPWVNSLTAPAPAKPVSKPVPKPAKPTTPAPGKPVVSLAALIEAGRADLPAATGHTTRPVQVRLVEAALVAEGLLDHRYAGDGSWGTTTRAAYAAWQHRLGYTGADANGIPGPTSLSALGKRHGFTTTP